MLLDGWTWEDMCLKRGVGCTSPGRGWSRRSLVGRGVGQPANENRDRALKTIRQAFADAKAYRDAKQAHADGKGPAARSRHALGGDAAGARRQDCRVFIDAEDIQQIQAALAFCRDRKAAPVIVGGYDAADARRCSRSTTCR